MHWFNTGIKTKAISSIQSKSVGLYVRLAEKGFEIMDWELGMS